MKLTLCFADNPKVSANQRPKPDLPGYAEVPGPTLRSFPWHRYSALGGDWIERYGQIRAQNVGYVSVSVPVPRSVLMWAIVNAMMVAGA